MNHYAINQSSFSAREEIWAPTAADKRETVVCPKPRRIGLFHTAVEPARPLVRWHMNHYQEDCDSKAGNELLDIILAKGNLGPDDSVMPPFFSGSPPSRVSNPLIQDARFGYESVSPPRGGGCVRANFGSSPAVRVEGFDCLDGDRRNCNIPTMA